MNRNQTKRHTEKKAFITVEAAIIIPFFVMAFLAVSSCMRLLQLETRIQQGMHIALSKAAGYTYFLERPEAYEIGGEEQENVSEILLQGGITAAYLHRKTVLAVGKEYLDHSDIMGGSNGLSVMGSLLPDAEGNLDFIVTYHVSVPILPKKFGVITVSQRECQRSWIGTKRWNLGSAEEEQERNVYVTENGSVYHLYLSCTYLNPGIEMAAFETVSQLRNTDGGKYYPCEICGGNTTTGTVFLTKSGSRYHGTLNCSSLKRGIKVIPLSEAGGRPCCTRCQKGR